MEFSSQIGNLTGDSLAAALDAAMLVAIADGSLAAEEVEELADSINEICEGAFDRDEIVGLLNSSFERTVESGADALIPDIANALDSDLSEVALAMAAAAGYTRGGVNMAEGVILQKLRAAMGIGEQRYFQLLGIGAQLAKS